MITNIIKQSVLVLLATVLLPLQGMGQGATLSIEDFSIKGGETQTMLIDVDNASMEVSQVEFFMHLPQGLSVSTENGLLAVDIAGRTTYRNHSLDAGIEDGDIHVILYSSTSSLTGTNGAVFSVKLVAAESFIGGDIVLKGQVLVSPDETESKPADYTYRVTTGAAPGTIIFADAEVKRLCVENWDTDGDGELSQAEAAAVTDLGQVFKDNSTINTFEELRFFTGLTAIGSRAFYNCNMLAKLSIPSSVTSICDHAFYGCYSLTSIAIPNSVTSLEPFAFCFTGLQTFTIPNSVTTLGDAVFNYSQSLRSVVIPGSVVSMGFNPLNGCSGIETIVVEGDNPAFDSRNNCNAIINTETNELVSGCKNTVIPANVTSIGKYAFGGCQYLKGITIPNSVTKIGVSSFYWCDRMTEITIPGSVNSIGANAFQDCDGLTKVTALMNQPFPIDENVFKYYDYSDKEYKFTTATLYVPAGTKEIYQNTAGWSLFHNIVEMGGEEPTPDIVRNVVMEEATGAWCGWCIRGIVSMKQAKEEFGDRFIGIAVHSSDVMSLNSYYSMNINGYPSCNIDRDGGIYDPSDLYVVRGRMNVAPTVGVSVKGEWNADKTTVTATSETQFLADGDGYSVAYVLVADGLTGTSSRWNQNNAYSGRTSSDPDLQAYCEMGSPITDMVYNDVMVGSSYSSSGVNQAESFGGTVKKGDKKSNSYTLSLPATGELAAAIDKNQVYVVAIVTNPDGTIANAAKAKVGGKAGDVNGDNTVDVADIASVISVMAKGGKDSVADVNVDGVVDVADISTIISIMAANARMGQTVE